MNTTTTTNNDIVADATAKGTLGRDLRFAARSLTWYDLGCVGLMITSLIAITAGFFG